MLKIKKINHQLSERFLTGIILLLVFSTLFMTLSIFRINFDDKNSINNVNQNTVGYKDEKVPKTSAQWAWINLTNDLEVDGKTFYHNTTITIEGILYNYSVSPPIPQGIQGYKIALIVDGKLYEKYNNITDSNGIFKIQNYTINSSMNIYSSHKIEAQIIGSTPGEVKLNNYLTIFANATSYFHVDNYNLNNPQLAGGYYDIPGFLNYDNHSGIPNQIINSIWYNETSEVFIPPNSPFNTNSDGSFKYIPIPDDNVSKIFYLNLTYNGNSTYINGSQKLISMSLYRNITCVWDTVSSAIEGNWIIIKGQLFARDNSNLKINYTEVELEFINGPSIGNITTDANGFFNHTYQIPLGIVGDYNISVELLNFPSVFSNTTHFIIIASAPIPPITPAEDIGDDDEETPPPFQNFFIIFIPIIIGIAAALGAFIIIHLRKQKEEAQIVKLPLEDRIRNLKILKDTGRLEEALS
ncbi:MAG: hypothetical protein ACFFAH_16400, partial [Promethearchaeota archaeon]